MTWETTAAVLTPDPGFTDARRQLHWAVRLVAGFGGDPAAPDDKRGRHGLAWNTALGALVTALVDAGNGVGFRAGLRIGYATLVIVDGNDIERGSFPLDGRTTVEAVHWLQAESVRLGGYPPAGSLAPITQGADDHPVAAGSPFDFGDGEGVGELAKWFGNAHHILSTLDLGVRTPAPIRGRPHDFDMAVQVPLGPDPSGGKAPSMRLGMSPGDASHDQPYWYALLGPKPDTGRDLPALGGGGAWQTGDARGVRAVLPAGRMPIDAKGQEAAVAAFLKSACNAGSVRSGHSV